MQSHAQSSVSMQRMEALKRRHAVLDRLVKEAQMHPSVTDAEIVDMKRQKLKLKEEMEDIKEDSQQAS